MTNLTAFILGIIQGLTEFLPVSSSGHLVLAQLVLNIYPPPYIFDIFVHLATLIAVVIFFRRSILELSIDYVFKLAVASLPILLTGFLVRDYIDQIFSYAPAVSLGLLATSLFNFYTHRQLKQTSNLLDLHHSQPQAPSMKQALTVGLFQTLATVPGVSRSGTTFFAATLSQLPATEAFRFSFLLLIPIILAANIYQLVFSGHDLTSISLIQLLIGGVAALIVALVSLKLLKKIVNNQFYLIFGFYCLILAITSWLVI